MAQSNFTVGEIVTLKSGSPDMTIKEIIKKDSLGFGVSPELEINKIITTWFEGNKLVEAEFTEPQLEKKEKTNDKYFS